MSQDRDHLKGLSSKGAVLSLVLNVWTPGFNKYVLFTSMCQALCQALGILRYFLALEKLILQRRGKQINQLLQYRASISCEGNEIRTLREGHILYKGEREQVVGRGDTGVD